MADDVTFILKNRIEPQPNIDLPIQQQNNQDNFLTSADTVLGNTANTAQILGGLAAAGGVTGGAGLVAVVLASLEVGILTALSQSNTSDSQVMQDILDGINDLKVQTGVNDWRGQMDSIYQPLEVVRADLQLISQYSDLQQLQEIASHAFDIQEHGLTLVNLMYGDPLIDPNPVWVRAALQSQAFDGGSGQAGPWWFSEPATTKWFGNLPTPSVKHLADGSPVVDDFQYPLPAYLYAIQSLLTIYVLVHKMDSAQPSFDQFLASPVFQGELVEYAHFLYSMYKEAVSGLVKSDLPSVESIIGYIYNAAVPYGAVDAGTAWLAWNLVYGVVNTYSVFHHPTPIPSSAPSQIIEIFSPTTIANPTTTADVMVETTTNADGEVVVVQPPVVRPSVRWLTCPWIRARVTLGLMARWKALYLYHGYDKAWSILQNLRIIARQPPDQELPLSPPDGTKANGNWSIRELRTVLTTLFQDPSAMPDATPETGFVVPFGWRLGRPTMAPGDTMSLFLLMTILEQLARGNWGGPATDFTPNRPLSFRECLSHAALVYP